jgi:hypothetical protein
MFCVYPTALDEEEDITIMEEIRIACQSSGGKPQAVRRNNLEDLVEIRTMGRRGN